MKIAFHVNQFTYRGTESALFDYAWGNINILKNESVIVSPFKSMNKNNNEVVNKFSKSFGEIYYYNKSEELEEWCLFNKVDAIYVIKWGKLDEFVWNIPTLIHCAFFMNEPHGFIYAGVSESVSLTNSSNKFEYVPHIINLPEDSKDFRKQLEIPESAIVFGRHGGEDTFDIPFVRDVILKVLSLRDDIYFIFAVRPNIFLNINHPKIKFIKAFVDPLIKRRFINTCDSMIHSSRLGESMGISVLEFSYCNKPVITHTGGDFHKQHLKNLGDKAILYNSYDDLLKTLMTFNKSNENKNWNVTENFTFEKIMKEFDRVFLEPVRNMN
jgi:hypothetical protein